MKEKKLKDCLNIVSGYAFKPKFFNDNMEGLPLIRVRDVNSGFSGKYYSGPYSDKYIINNGDLLVGMDGDFRCIKWFNSIAILNQRVCKLMPNPNILNKSYLLHFLPKALDEIHRKTTYTTVKHLSAKKIGDIDIKLPSLIDQKRIAQVLSDCETLIAQRKESIALLDELVQSTFLEMFGDPVVNPKNFKQEPLKIFYLSNKTGTKCGPFGSALKKNEFAQSGVPVWNMDNISKKGKFKFPVNLYVEQHKFDKLSNYATQPHDIIISRAGTVGKMCILDSSLPKGIISTNLIRLRLDPQKLLPIYFVTLMTYFKGRIGRLKTGADGGFTHMGTKVLDSLKIPYPSINLQIKFAVIIEKIEQTKQSYENHLTELENLYGKLSQDAFKGELDLSSVVLQENEYSIKEDKLALAAEPESVYKKGKQTKVKTKYTNVDYYKRMLLAAEIVHQLKDDKSLGHLKLQKLLYLCQESQKMQLPLNFLKQAMGPYDPKLARSLDAQFKAKKWFQYNFKGYPKYSALDKYGSHKEDYLKYFAKENEAIQHLINLFRKFNSDQIEIVGTLYACWQDVLQQDQLFSESLIIKKFYDWSEKKKRFTKKQLNNALGWMREKGIYPKGYSQLGIKSTI